MGIASHGGQDEAEFRLGYVTDAEGNMDFFSRCVDRSDVVWWSDGDDVDSGDRRRRVRRTPRAVELVHECVHLPVWWSVWSECSLLSLPSPAWSVVSLCSPSFVLPLSFSRVLLSSVPCQHRTLCHMILRFSPNERRLELRDGAFFVFGGDCFDKGPHSFRIARHLIDLKRRYGCEIIFCVQRGGGGRGDNGGASNDWARDTTPSPPDLGA